MAITHEEHDRRATFIGLDARTAPFTYMLPKANLISPFCTYTCVRTDSSPYVVTVADGSGFTASLFQRGDRVTVYSDGQNYYLESGNTFQPTAMPDADPIFRTVIRDSRISGGTGAADPPEWAQSTGVTAETEIGRGLVLAHELTGSGRFVFHSQGQLLLTNGQSGACTLRVYSSTDPNPSIALGSATLRATHTVTIADPLGGAALGDYEWIFRLLPCGTQNLTNIQIWRSLFSYRRHDTDPLIEDKAGGQLSSITAPVAPDFHVDQLLIFTTQKAAGWTNGRLLPYAQDAYVHHGESNAA